MKRITRAEGWYWAQWGSEQCGFTSRAGPVRSARLQDNKQNCHRVITHAWLLWALTEAARRGEVRENEGMEKGWEGSLLRTRPLITGWRITSSEPAATAPWPQSTTGNIHIQISNCSDLFVCRHTERHSHRLTLTDRHQQNKWLCSGALPSGKLSLEALPWSYGAPSRINVGWCQPWLSNMERAIQHNEETTAFTCKWVPSQTWQQNNPTRHEDSYTLIESLEAVLGCISPCPLEHARSLPCWLMQGVWADGGFPSAARRGAKVSFEWA